MLTADTVTDEQIRGLRDRLMQKKRKTAGDRARILDCNAALAGDRCCRESIADQMQGALSLIALPDDLIVEIERYLDTGKSNNRGPSCARNTAGSIGERVASIYRERRAEVLGTRGGK